MFDTPLHPKLVHFPIAFLVGALLLDVISRIVKKEQFYQAAVTLFVMAAFFALAAIVSGLWEASRLHLKHPILDKHQMCAYLATAGLWVGMVFLWVLRKKVKLRRLIFTVLLIFSCLCVLLAAHWGGTMVYQYSVGVSS